MEIWKKNCITNMYLGRKKMSVWKLTYKNNQKTL